MTSQDGFVHLHVHSEYSMLDGAARVNELFSGAERMGMPALAVTDHGNLFGAYEFYKAAKNFPVKPIIGLEAYLTPKTHRSERKRVAFGDGSGDDVSASGAYTHLTIWSETTAGMHNLFRLSSRSSIEGFFYKPRADRELLSEYAKGLIATTGCPSGEVQTYLRLGQYDEAVRSAGEFKEIFGAGNYFVELMDHGLPIERGVRNDLLKLAKQVGLPLVATNDLHYVHPQDAESHSVLLCVQSGKTLDDPTRFKFEGDGYYLKSAAEMRQLFADLPEACDNTLAIAERCDVTFSEGMGTFMPRFGVPEGETEDSWFTKEVARGLKVRYPNGVPAHVKERADFETSIISAMGFSGYFLVVADFINWAKENGIRVGPGRGSGAGSMCAYAMRITDLDPIEHGLLFERFLNPERVSMPDFDIDFDDRRRSEVISYVSQKYGEDRVAQIVTYGTIKAKQAVKDASRVLNKPFSIGEKITKAMPPAVMGKDVPLAGLFDPTHERYAEGGEFRELVESDPEVRQVVETAQGIEGLKRQWGVHAAGVIMSSEPLLEIIPIMKREQDGAILTQFDYPGCEALGLMKMDFLGLRNLTVLDDAVRNIRSNRGIEVVLEELTLDDPVTYALLQRGDTLGVFQLDGGPMRSLLRSMRPDKFNDISAVGALYRPGPMGADSHNKYARRKTGREPVEAIHPELAEPLAEILEETYGLIVYQEQVMAIAQRLAGYSLGAADLLRRAMGKKKKKELDAQYEEFSAGMAERGYSPGAVQTIWDILLPFSDYAFNKSHSAAYGVISYWTAYLKANFPAEYMAALLQSVKDDKDKSAVYLAECRRMGIKVLPPDVNFSAAEFTAVGEDIRFGLAAIRNVGLTVVDEIVEGRRLSGPATDFHSFLDHVGIHACNKRVVESLIKAGAFDSMGHSRRALMEVYESAIDQVLDLKRNQANGQDDLFGTAPTDSGRPSGVVPELPDWDKRTKLAFEREMLGLYVSDHPLQGLEHVIGAQRDYSLDQLRSGEGPKDGSVSIAGMITQITRKQTRAGDAWAIVTVEDLDASMDVLLFPKVFSQVATTLSTDTIVKVRGRIRVQDDTVEMTGQELGLVSITDVDDAPVVVSIPANRCTPAVVERLKEVLKAHPGVSEVQIRLVSPDRTTLMRVPEGLRVKSSQPLMADLKALLGPASVGA